MNWRQDKQQILAPWLIVIITGIFAIIFWAKAFSSASSLSFPAEQDILFYYLNQIIPYDSIVGKIIAFAIVAGVAIILFFANNKYFFIKNKSALIILFMVLLMGLNDPSHNLNPGIISLPFLLIAFIRFLGMHGKLYTGARSFDIGFYLSLASLFYDRMLFFIPLFYIGFYMYQQLHIKNLMASFFGISFPYIIVGGISYLTNDIDNFFARLPLYVQYNQGAYVGHIIYYGTLGLIALYAFVHFLSKFNTEKIKTRTTILFIYTLLTGSIILSFFSQHIFLFEMPIITFFLSLILAHLFSIHTSRFARTIFYAFWVFLVLWFLVIYIL